MTKDEARMERQKINRLLEPLETDDYGEAITQPQEVWELMEYARERRRKLESFIYYGDPVDA